MKKIKEILTKDKVERALKTFLEGFCSYIAYNVMTSDLSDRTAVNALIVGAIGSAISVVINSFKKDGE